MARTFASAAALCLAAVAVTLPASAAGAGPVQTSGRTLAIAAPAPRSAPAVRKLHAVLRYDAATAAACRNFSEMPSEVCLLIALNVIRMSENPLPGRSL